MVVCYEIGNSKHVHILDFKQGLRSFLNRPRFIFNTANIFVFMKYMKYMNVHDHDLSKLHDCTLWWHLTIAKSWLGNHNFEICYQWQFCFRYFGSFKWIILSCKTTRFCGPTHEKVEWRLVTCFLLHHFSLNSLCNWSDTFERWGLVFWKIQKTTIIK